MNLSTGDKVRALRDLTRGAPDVFAVRTESEREGEGARWRPVYAPLSDANVLSHLSGAMEIGSYPLVPDVEWPRCYWVLADFDGKKQATNWRGDVQRLVEFLLDFDGCPCFVNLSRSGQGAHVRMLFHDSVPAWMARRWFNAYLEEAGVLAEDEWDVPKSFDRIIPPQDNLSLHLTRDGERRPGNLAGSPLFLKHARRHGGTIPLDPHEVARGNFEPDGRHWEHVMTALDARDWGEEELRAAMEDAPGDVDTTLPGQARRYGTGSPLPVVTDGSAELSYIMDFCEFMVHMRRPGTQTYPLWVAIATQLHRFGEDGREAFHEISALDPRYEKRTVEEKWRHTGDMLPIRCDTLVHLGYRCPHLTTKRCNHAKAPTYFAHHTDAEIL